MRKIKAAAVLSFFSVLGVQAQDGGKVVLEGRVDRKFDNTKVFLYNNITGENDTAVVRDGAWRMERPFSGPTRHMLAAEAESKKHGGYAPFGILIGEPSKIIIEGDLESFYTAQVSGSKAHDVLNAYNRLVGETNEAEALMTVVRNHPNSFASAFILERYGKVLTPEQALACYEGLSDAVKKTDYGKSAGNQIQGALLSKEGALVKNFSLPNEKGENIDFAVFKGKYILLDFWASWCGPCIEEFKTLREVYAQYKKSAPFEIVSISTDKSEGAWKKALQNQQLPWVQLHDLPEDQAVASKRFAVTTLPTTFLIDPEGKIIKKNIRGNDLKVYLQELFSK
ncbi:TlpA family protein disulfide reductase [Sphingobacterium psychroaquaticum]|uniref:TlpA family protein disulfide reductase n=1 Tax=Sphingobacterium psychroaquaticum TaxID=561061 RepID=UPI00141AA752|nr:TlpA disulfide reductase family protein [Sphingobacterium psychroaquaticum]